MTDIYRQRLTEAWLAARQGSFATARAAYRAAIALDPARLEAWVGLAECEFAARRPEASLAAWDQAIRLAPSTAALLCGKAAVYRSGGQAAAADALYDEALAIDPSSTTALLGKIGLARDAGQIDAAATALAGIQPAERMRLDVRWAAARLYLALGRPGDAREEATALLATPGLADAQRAEGLLLMGEALGDLDDPAAAFRAAVAGKAVLHRLYAERAAGRESEAEKAVRLGRWWGAAPDAAWSAAPRAAAPVGDEARAHVFVVGFPRSGTTLLEQVLAGHPDVVALEEAPTFADHYAEFLASDDDCARLATLTAADADRWRERYWATVADHGVDVGGRTFVDKAPAGTLYLPLVARLFPAARIVFAQRDPRDVVLSCLRNAFQMNAMTYAFTTLAGTAACYDAVMAMAASYRRRLPLPVLDVRHEAFVADLPGQVARLTAFLDLTPHGAMRDVAATAARRDVRTPSARQVRAGVNARGVGRWRACAAELAPVRPILAPWVAAFGYPPD